MQTDQNSYGEFNPATNRGQQYGVNDFPTRCHSVPARDIQNHFTARNISSYRPNSSHQYLSAVDTKESTIQEANVHLGKPTRTS